MPRSIATFLTPSIPGPAFPGVGSEIISPKMTGLASAGTAAAGQNHAKGQQTNENQ